MFHKSDYLSASLCKVYISSEYQLNTNYYKTMHIYRIRILFARREQANTGCGDWSDMKNIAGHSNGRVLTDCNNTDALSYQK